MPVVAVSKFPIAERGRSWDNTKAERSIRKWAGGPDKDKINFSKYRKGFLWYDGSKPDSLTSYKLPFVEVINGRPHIVPRGVFATAGGRGVDATKGIPAADKAKIKRNITRLYKRMATQFQDDSIESPFEKEIKLEVNEGDEVIVEGQEQEDKIHTPDGMWIPLGMATTFTELDASIEARKLTQSLGFLVQAFGQMADNILFTPDITNKGTAISDLALQLSSRIRDTLTEQTNREVTPEFEEDHPLEKAEISRIVKQKGNVALLKDAAGKFHLYGRFTNNIYDREDEVLVDDSHKEFIKWLDEHPEHAPELWSWHEEGTARKNRASWWEYSDGFVHMIWPLEDDEAKGVEKFIDAFEPGMSHGFYVLKRNNMDRYQIVKYRTFEASLLPLKYAANPYTSFGLVQGKAMFSDDKFQSLELLHGRDLAEALQAQSEDDSKTLDAEGVARKDDEGQPEAEPQTTEETTPTESNEAAPPAETPEAVKAEGELNTESHGDNDMNEQFEKSLVEALDVLKTGIEGLSQRLNAVEKKMTGLEAAKDQTGASRATLASWLSSNTEASSIVGSETAAVKEEDDLNKPTETESTPIGQNGHVLNGMFPKQAGQ